MRSIIIASILVFMAANASAQDTAVLRRTPYLLTLAVDAKTTYEEPIKNIPYLYPNRSVQMYPGETIYLEVELSDSTIVKMKAVKEVSKPSSTLTLKFAQTASKNVHQSMMLTVENPFPLRLTYETMIFTLKYKNWVSTNVYPVEAGLSAFEIWPDLITSIALGNWKFRSKE